MNIKQIVPMMLLASAPVAAFAQGKAGIRAENLDRSVNPATNFYQFATGGWQKLNPLPAAYSRYGSFDLLQEDNNKRINSILTSLLKTKAKKGSIEQKLGDFYKLAMDSVRRNKEGVAPIKPLLNEMEAAKTTAELQALQKKYAIFGYGEAAGTFFGADEKNAIVSFLNCYLYLAHRHRFVILYRIEACCIEIINSRCVFLQALIKAFKGLFIKV